MSLSPKTRFKIPLRAADIKYLVEGSEYTYDEIKELISDMLNDVLTQTLLDINIWIDYHVPKRTGKLRFSLKKNLQSSNVSRNILKLIMGTAVDYAKEVNKMTQGQVRHTGTNKENDGSWAYANYWGHSGRIYLDDPQAVGHFWDKLLSFTKERIIINLTKAKYELAKVSKLTTRKLTRVVVE